MSILETHIPIAPHAWVSGNGLAVDVLLDRSIAGQVDKYHTAYADELAEHGIPAPKGWLYNPFGRWLPCPVYGSLTAFTSMRLDAAMLAKVRLSWLYQSVRARCELHDLGIYIGSNPVGGLALMALLPFRRFGITFDASALQTGSVVDTYILGMHRDGVPVYREANRWHDDDVPCVAAWDKWDRNPRTFYGMDNAPDGSVCWFQGGINSAPEWNAAERAVKSGLGLRVNLRATKNRTRLYKLIGGVL